LAQPFRRGRKEEEKEEEEEEEEEGRGGGCEPKRKNPVWNSGKCMRAISVLVKCTKT